jgi:aerobic-type carbon monoxide dehydrogenase small subunit (CoxS/CutS family)
MSVIIRYGVRCEDCRKGTPMATQLIVNGKSLSPADDPRTPLLWVLRDTFGLTGTKFGCGIAHRGAGTVVVDGEAVRSCVTPVARVGGKRITTIEGLSTTTATPCKRPGPRSRSRSAAIASPAK